MFLIERVILVTANLGALTSLFFLPRSKALQHHLVFLVVGLPTWIIGLLVVEWDLLAYPVREFASINRTSFCFEYFLLPVACIHYNAWYPETRPRWVKALYLLFFCTALTVPEAFVERYTQLIRYQHWDWYVTFITEGLLFLFSRAMLRWFFRPSSHRMT
ncbi:CBO0543 family protein [Paenibacillus sp. S-38]|uniref:CBO0543 family protein n=1 Tax=Paenibacillus sp. S-38 TaxID=3416710 RepID=UPI003CED62A5